MNKSDLVNAVAESAELTKTDAAKAVDAVLSSVTKSLSQKEQVTLIGFGTFSVRERAARTGRNPRTGKPLEIKAAKVPVFKPGKTLKDAVN